MNLARFVGQIGNRDEPRRRWVIARYRRREGGEPDDEKTRPVSEQPPPRLQPTQANHGESLKNNPQMLPNQGMKLKHLPQNWA